MLVLLAAIGNRCTRLSFATPANIYCAKFTYRSKALICIPREYSASGRRCEVSGLQLVVASGFSPCLRADQHLATEPDEFPSHGLTV
jgi:hypothetical protein